MAWRCSGETNEELIQNMSDAELIKSPRVVEAMKKVDRANYVLDKNEAYQDSPQSIRYGATISAPHMHAHAAEYLLDYLKPGSRVLDVGSGSGYTAAVFHHLVSPGGIVVGMDHIRELVDWSSKNLKADNLNDKLGSREIIMICGDGRKGFAEQGPYDSIHVGAAAPTMPSELIDQLASPGRMFIPIGEHEQDVWVVDKNEKGEVSKKRLFGVRYVPLTDRHKQVYS